MSGTHLFKKIIVHPKVYRSSLKDSGYTFPITALKKSKKENQPFRDEMDEETKERFG